MRGLDAWRRRGFRPATGRSPIAENINLLLSEFRGTCGNYACPYDAFQPLRPLMQRSYCRNAAKPRRGKRRMVNSIEGAIDPEPAHPSRLLEQAINNLSLGLIIFDNKREVVFCNTPTNTSGSALEMPPFQPPSSRNSRMAGSLSIPFIRCRTVAGWPLMRTSPGARK